MRLIAVPLARARPGATPISTFIAQRSKRIKPSSTKLSSDGEGESQGKPVIPFTTRMLSKASNFWMDMGRADQKSTLDWKRRTYTLGEKLMDRIEYQEWALKGVDPALGPRLNTLSQKSTDSDEGKSKPGEIDRRKSRSDEKVSLLYPPSLLSPAPLLASLESLTSHRTPHHYRRLWLCVAGMPFTIPFALIPVIPNLPFFYLVFRAYSHWKAYKSSAYLAVLLQQKRIKPTPSPEIDSIFKADTNHSIQAENVKRDANQESEVEAELILQKSQIEAMIKRLELQDWARTDLNRARMQVERSIQEGKIDKLGVDESSGQ
ncbi:hypothetical protein IE53DRAFT_374924 [Violaceomyces palustris]|uniref:Uncharacterized protein n=1 Tax=Violaceomyces palustris TaxID=1673888 RepID=A0ACD0NVI5_9BASI|nr:hypothetical protein IE53DRAFT_374924 [Violaceomyces palustris]